MRKKTKILLIAERLLGQYMLEALLRRREQIDILAVLTRHQHTKNWWEKNTIKALCKKYHIPCFPSDPEVLDELMCTVSPDIGIAVLNNNFTSAKYLHWIKRYSVNIHGAPLPYYQGKNCTHFAILNNEKWFGSTLYLTSEEKDEGTIVGRSRFAIPPQCTNVELYQLNIIHGRKLIDEHVHHILTGDFKTSIPFDKKKSCRYNDLGPREINVLKDSPEYIDRKVRAFFFPPMEPAFFTLKKKRFYLLPKNYEYSH